MSNEELIARIQAGIDVSDNMLALYEQMKGAIYQIARKYSGLAELDDLKQEGYIALCSAVENYSPVGGVPFINYAWKCIAGQLQSYVYSNSPVRIPRDVSLLLGRYRRLCQAFLLEHGREPSEGETAHFLGLSKEQTTKLLKAVRMEHTVSLDTPISEEGENTLGDTLAGEESTDQEVLDRMQQEQLNRELWECVNSLPGKQPDIIKKRFQEGMTLQAVGEMYGISTGVIRSTEKKALRTLRREPYRDRLLRYDGIYSAALHGNGVERFKQTWTSSTERVALGL